MRALFYRLRRQGRSADQLARYSDNGTSISSVNFPEVAIRSRVLF